MAGVHADRQMSKSLEAGRPELEWLVAMELDDPGEPDEACDSDVGVLPVGWHVACASIVDTLEARTEKHQQYLQNAIVTGLELITSLFAQIGVFIELLNMLA
jgi:hypothetical protein